MRWGTPTGAGLEMQTAGGRTVTGHALRTRTGFRSGQQAAARPVPDSPLGHITGKTPTDEVIRKLSHEQRARHHPGNSPRRDPRRLTVREWPPTCGCVGEAIDHGQRVSIVARRAAYGSLAACLAAIAAAFAAAALGPSGDHVPAVIVSVACCLTGFVSASVAEALGALGSERRVMWLGLAGLIGNLVVASLWVVVTLSVLSTT